MAVVAVAHQDTDRAKTLARRIAACGRGALAPVKACVIGDLSLVPAIGTPKMPEIDVLCLDAAHPELVPKAVEGGGCELIALDATRDQLVELLRHKPVAALSSDESDAQTILAALNDALRYVRRRNRFFCVRSKTRSLRVPYDAIRYFESGRKRVIIHSSDENDLSSFTATLDSVAKSLPEGRFVRCHQSFLVNADAVRGVNRAQRALEVAGGELVNVSDRYYHDVLRIFASADEKDDPKKPKTSAS